MATVQQFIVPIVAALGWAILHFLWQGALIGLAAHAVLTRLERCRPESRYGASCAALGVCGAIFTCTFLVCLGVVVPVWPAPASAAPVRPSDDGIASLPRVMWVACAWSIGVLVLAARASLHLVVMRRLRTSGVSELQGSWNRTATRILDELGLDARVRVLQSALAESPVVVGWISPIVLMPVAAFSSLTPAQLRAVLVHELTHIARKDHIVNAAQVAIETLLFFHPVTWWLSRTVRAEREHCCDDAAVRATGSARVLAEALISLESQRVPHPQAAIAAHGGQLMERITRILGVQQQQGMAPRRLPVVPLLLAFAVAAVGVAHATAIDQPQTSKFTEVLREAVRDGAMTREEARALYDAIVLPGTQQQRQMEADLIATARDVEAALAGGRITQEQAREKLAWLDREMESKRSMAFSVEVLGMDRGEAWLEDAREKIEEHVQAGAMSREDADAKIEAMRHTAQVKQRAEADFREAERAIEIALAEGEITSEQAARKLEALRAGITMRIEKATIERQVKAALERRDLTEEEAEEKLHAVRQGMRAKRPAHSEELQAVKRRLDAAVDSGRISEAEARQRLELYLDEQAQRRDRMAAAREKIRRAVESGDLTRTEAATKLEQLQGQLERRRALELEYEVVARKLRQMVDSGEITRAQMAERLARLRSRSENARSPKPE